MKNIIKAIALSFFCAAIILGLSLAALAVEPVDTEKSAALTVQYKRGEAFFEGLEIETYKIADVFEDGTFELCAPFADYPVNIHGITSQTEWKKIAETLAAFAAADKIEADLSAVTDGTGTVKFEDIKAGMYLTLSERVETEKDVTVFENFITVLPAMGEDEGLEYNVKAFPKCAEYEIKPVEKEYNVIKLWKDTAPQKRPETVKIDILKNGELFASVVLSDENNWSHTWKAVDDNSNWQAVEREVPDGWTVTVEEKGDTIVVTNTSQYTENNAPQTGVVEVLWPYALAACFAGVVILMLAAVRKRKA